MLMAAVWLVAGPARAQPLVAASGVTSGAEEDVGGWVVVPENPAPQSTLMFIPPRGAGVPEGQVIPVRALVSTPLFAAAQRGRVFLVFEAAQAKAFRGEGQPKPRGVFSISSERAAQGNWEFLPPDRLDVHPSLGGEGTVTGLGATADELFALRRMPDGVPMLDVLTHEGWSPVLLPSPWTKRAPESVMLVGSGPGIGLATVGAASIEWWVGTRPESSTEALPTLTDEGVPESAAGGAVALAPMVWKRSVLTLPSELRDVSDLRVTTAGRWLVVGGAAGGTWKGWAWSLSGAGEAGSPPIRLADVAVPDAPAGVVGLSGGTAGDRVVLIMPPGIENRDPRRRIEVAELSAGTGRELYRGPVAMKSTVGPKDYAVVGVALVMAIAMVLGIVINPSRAAVSLPDQCSIAEPLRRVVASLIDLTVGVFIVARVMRVDLGGVGDLSWWMSLDGQWALVSLLGVMILQGAVLEGMLGRTLGKSLTGCLVVDVQPGAQDEPRPAGVLRALVRNAVKWGVPPLGLTGLLDAGGRGRPDQFAGSAVVTVDAADDEGDE
ncbi:MAG: hypothetical protein DYG92_01195 [Leptolyngbya sp. PLA1]|nr:hypothetical protein [Leptolyngbya sp. PLA1]